jgi:Zn-finger nucleic acid-binding protein
MTPISLDGRLGTKVEIDLCAGCRGFWFDQYESLRLAPGATLKLFTLMGEQGSTGRSLPPAMMCPRCGTRLALTHDMQHSTAFQYWRCPQQHGHFITFLEFLKEKDFVRPLTAQQIADLRQNVQTVNCSNCGGPIDLAKASACPHCGSPLSMLDIKQMQQMVAQLKTAEQHTPEAAQTGNPAGSPRAVNPALQIELERVRLDTERHFAMLGSSGDSESLVEAGLRLVAGWLKTP